jgi:hypothetical protein
MIQFKTNLKASQTLALTLFMTSVGALNEHFSFTAYDFAVLANPLDAGSDFHRYTLFINGKASQNTIID